jgi:hypothetical protein
MCYCVTEVFEGHFYMVMVRNVNLLSAILMGWGEVISVIKFFALLSCYAALYDS